MRARPKVIGEVSDASSCFSSTGAPGLPRDMRGDNLDTSTVMVAESSSLPADGRAPTMSSGSGACIHDSSSPSGSTRVNVSLVSYADFHAQFEHMSRQNAACACAATSKANAPSPANLPAPDISMGDCVLSIHAPPASSRARTSMEIADAALGPLSLRYSGSDCSSVEELLASLRIEPASEYARAFASERVELADLPFLLDEDFARLIPLMGPRRRLQAWLRLYYSAQIAESISTNVT